MIILVTGHMGFIGSHLVPALKEAGHSVVGFDKKDSGHDLRFKDSISGMMSAVQPDLVIHLAASVSVPASIDNPSEYWMNNVIGTSNLLEAMRPWKVQKIIFAGSSSVYGDLAQEDIGEHRAEIADQLSPYAASKRMCERLLRIYAHCYGMQYMSLRFFNVFGAGCRGVIAKWRKDQEDGDISIQYGNTIRDYTHVSNVIIAILGAIDASEKAWNDDYNVGCGVGTSLTELARMMGVNTIEAGPNGCDVETCTANIYKTRKWLGYVPVTSLRDGLKDL